MKNPEISLTVATSPDSDDLWSGFVKNGEYSPLSEVANPPSLTRRIHLALATTTFFGILALTPVVFDSLNR